ncbi:hypothetical protein LCGC14_2283800 [marine sediment metagenome]|uniref:HNH nuclease domain-containing protein n=1 Tax=marine sediment metagenome TaxID=412755 RepID=A0A0F9CT40_9ZZZZ
MIKKFCQYCKKELEFEKPQQFGAHVRNCAFYPYKKRANKKGAQKRILLYHPKNKYIFTCNCGNSYELFLTASQYKYKKYKKYCSSFCAHSFIKRKIRKPCTMCDKVIKRHADKFCSNKCQGVYNYKQYIEKWKKGELSGNRGDKISAHIRKYIFEKYNNTCAQCGWDRINKYSDKIPLEMHHIDGNCKNTIEKNLILLCPNCHSLTENYGGLNRGHGRSLRYKNINYAKDFLDF